MSVGYYIYELRHRASEVRYVGSTSDPQRRRGEHSQAWLAAKEERLRSSRPLYDAWLRTLPSPPEMHVLPGVSQTQEDVLEREYEHMLRLRLHNIPLANQRAEGWRPD